MGPRQTVEAIKPTGANGEGGVEFTGVFGAGLLLLMFIVVDKEAKGMPLTWITSSFKGYVCCFQVNLYVGHEVQDLFWGIEVGINAAYYESYVNVSDLLMLVIHLKNEEYGCHCTELEAALYHRRHKHTLCNELPQVVQGNALHVKGVLEEQGESLLQEGAVQYMQLKGTKERPSINLP